jgi:hypothetical protein
LLGTLDYEPWDDFKLPNGQVSSWLGSYMSLQNFIFFIIRRIHVSIIIWVSYEKFYLYYMHVKGYRTGHECIGDVTANCNVQVFT